MAFIREDRVQETTTTTGTGSLTLAGAVTGYRTFGSVMANGDICEYTIDDGTGNWESGVGTWTTGNIFLRTKVERTSSGANSAITLAAGTKKVFMTYLGSRNPRTIRLGFLSDSSLAQQGTNGRPTPEILKDLLAAGGGVDVDIKNLSINGSTWFRTYNTPYYGGANSALNEMIAWRPDVVICSFGFNDVIGNADGRLLSQIKADADVVFDTLKGSLPGSLLIYALQDGYDRTNFNTANLNLKNKSITPYGFELPAAGITAGAYGSEMLENVLSAPTQNLWANLDSLGTYIKGRPNVTANITSRIWKCHRLGMSDVSLGHQNALGHQFIAAGFYRDLCNVASFTALFPRQFNASTFPAGWESPDDLFNYYLVVDGAGGWKRAANLEISGTTGEAMMAYYGSARLIAPQTWYLPWKTRFQTYPPDPIVIANSIDADGLFLQFIENGPPGANVLISINGGAFGGAGANTDNGGHCIIASLIGQASLPGGTYTVRYKAGNEIYGPFSMTLTTNPIISPRTHFGSGGALVSNNIITFPVLGNYFSITGTNTVSLLNATGWSGGQPVTLRFTANGALLKHNQAQSGANVPVLLADANDYVTSANSMIEFVYDDSLLAFVEIQRTGISYRTPLNLVAPSGGTAEPQTPPANTVMFYARDYANKVFPKFMGPAGLDYPIQPHQGFARVAFLGPNSTTNMTCTNFSTPIVVSNAVVHPAQSTGSYRNQTRRFTLASAGAAGSLASLRLTTTECWRGNAAGLGGFFMLMRFALTTLLSGNRGFFGLSDVLTAPTNVDPTTSTAPGKIGIAFALNSGNLKFVYNLTGSAPTVIDLGANFTVDTSNTYELIMFCAPNDTRIGYKVTNLQTGANVANTISTNIPATTTFLSPVAWMTNNASTPGVAFDIIKWHLECDS